jgi:isoleucyl-tRNA synthetase
MSFDYEASIAREFLSFMREGYVFKRRKPVHWCPSCVTALAEAEVEYADKESPSVYVRFRISDAELGKRFPQLVDRKVFIVIWTTTPWTLPANLALAVHPDLQYAAVEKGDSVCIIAYELLGSLREKLAINGSVLLEMKGSELEGLVAGHPFIERTSKIILGDFVTVSEGTGIVHIAPGHGEDDYEMGLKYGLDIYAPVDDRGKFTVQAGDLAGQFVFKANETIMNILKNKNSLMRDDKVRHSYPHCWRCKKPVIFRATEQWFILVEHRNLRQKCLNEINTVSWIPKWGKERIYGMVSNRPDWCISRQRAWGVPITLIRCNDCGEFVTDEEVFSRIISLFSENGADIWFIKDAKDFLPPEYACGKCRGTSFSKEMDILDVWFDSGVSHAAVVEPDKRLSWPASLYLEGSDQHRGWFQSSLLASVGTRGTAPYRTVLTHGFVVDGQGKKMSKSLGNVVAPQEVIKVNGAELLRLWVSAEDYRDDIRISKEILDRLTEAYRKLRNTARFMLGNLHDFDCRDHSSALLEIDRWAMSRLQSLILKVSASYENFDFHEVFHALYSFCVVDMSSFYLDVLKDRLYTFKSDSPERRAAQWVLDQTLSVLTRLMAPILSFTAEEIWGYIKDAKAKEQSAGDADTGNQKPLDDIGSDLMKESVFLAKFPESKERFLDKELETKWSDLFMLRDEVNKALELKRAERFIGNSLEAKVILRLPEKYSSIVSSYAGFLPTFFIVSAAELSDKSREGSYMSEQIPGLEIAVEKAPGEKCQRCWNRSLSVGEFIDAPEVCDRCYRVISG